MSKLSEFRKTVDEGSEKQKAKAVKLKEKVNKVASKAKGFNKNTWWEIGAYIVRTISVGVPACVIMTLENSWVKSGIGLLATFLLIALAIIYKEPIKKAAGFAPGVFPFLIFVIIALFFNTTANALLTIGLSGLGGSIVAIPLHYKYLQSKKPPEEDPQLTVLKDIANKLSNLDNTNKQ
jgi:hypothetical protein